MLAGIGTAQAVSKCDSALSKAAGKEVGCRCSAYSKADKKGGSPDFSKCTKFAAACAKAQTAGDCSVFAATNCGSKQTQADNAAAAVCNGSPSGAFLE
jgi:hypothetical protein